MVEKEREQKRQLKVLFLEGKINAKRSSVQGRAHEE
jgi:hypothetical protein